MLTPAVAFAFGVDLDVCAVEQMFYVLSDLDVFRLISNLTKKENCAILLLQ